MSLELELKREIRMTRMRRAILSSIGILGVATVAIMAPNALQLLGKIPTKNRNFQIRSTAKRLADAGLIRFERNGETTRLRLTPKGKEYLRIASHSDFEIPHPRKWDGKWRIVIFDIPEYRGRLRRHLAVTLLHVGLYRLQDSVWVHPFDCEDFIVLLKADFRIGKDVLYIIADKIENDRALWRHFNLP